MWPRGSCVTYVSRHSLHTLIWTEHPLKTFSSLNIHCHYIIPFGRSHVILCGMLNCNQKVFKGVKHSVPNSRLPSASTERVDAGERTAPMDHSPISRAFKLQLNWHCVSTCNIHTENKTNIRNLLYVKSHGFVFGSPFSLSGVCLAC